MNRGVSKKRIQCGGTSLLLLCCVLQSFCSNSHRSFALINAIPIVGWIISFLLSASLAIPFYFIWIFK